MAQLQGTSADRAGSAPSVSSAVGKKKPRPNAVGANVLIEAVYLGCSGHAEALLPQPACDDLGLIIQQTDPGSGIAADVVVERDRD